jgi:hypothetical protein
VILEPVGIVDLHRGPRLDRAFDLAALHCEVDLGGAAESRDRFELGAGKDVELFEIGDGGRSRAGAAHDGLACLRVLEGFRLRGARGVHHLDHGCGAADVSELAGVVLDALRLQHLLDGEGLGRSGDRGAVARRHVVEPVGHGEAAGTRHVLRHHRRVARDVLRHVLGDEATVEVIAASRNGADVIGDGLAPEEVLDRIGGCCSRQERRGANGRRSENTREHYRPPCIVFLALITPTEARISALGKATSRVDQARSARPGMLALSAVDALSCASQPGSRRSLCIRSKFRSR